MKQSISHRGWFPASAGHLDGRRMECGGVHCVRVGSKNEKHRLALVGWWSGSSGCRDSFFCLFVFVCLMTLRGCASLLCPSLVRGPSRRQVGCCKTNRGAHYSLDSNFTWGLGGRTVWLGYRELG